MSGAAGAAPRVREEDPVSDGPGPRRAGEHVLTGLLQGPGQTHTGPYK